MNSRSSLLLSSFLLALLAVALSSNVQICQNCIGYPCPTEWGVQCCNPDTAGNHACCRSDGTCPPGTLGGVAALSRTTQQNLEEESIETLANAEDSSKLLLVREKPTYCYESCLSFLHLGSGAPELTNNRACVCQNYSPEKPAVFLHNFYIRHNNGSVLCATVNDFKTLNSNLRDYHVRNIMAQCAALGCTCGSVDPKIYSSLLMKTTPPASANVQQQANKLLVEKFTTKCVDEVKAGTNCESGEVKLV